MNTQCIELFEKLRKKQKRKERIFFIAVAAILFIVLFSGCVQETVLIKDADTNQKIEISNYFYEKLPDGAENIRLIEQSMENKMYGDVWMTFDLEGNHFLIGMYGGGDRFGMCLTQVVKEKDKYSN